MIMMALRLLLILIPSLVILFFPLVIMIARYRASRNWRDRPCNASVNLVVPLAPSEEHLSENATTLLSQKNTAGYEVIFVAEDPQHQSAQIANALVTNDREARSLIVYSGDPKGSVAKMHNLHRAVRECRNDIVIFVDSDVRFQEENIVIRLSELLADPEVGLVTAAPQYHNPRTVGGYLAATMINADLWGYFATLSCVGRLNVANGAIMAMSRKTLNDIGDFTDLQFQILNDTAIARKILKTRKRVCLSFEPAFIETPLLRVSDWWRQAMRWHIGMRMVFSKTEYILYGLQRSPLLISLIFFFLWPDYPSSVFVLVIPVTARLVSFLIIQAIWLREKSALPELIIAPVTDLIASVLWIFSCFRTEISWRGRTYTVEKGGKAVTTN